MATTDRPTASASRSLPPLDARVVLAVFVGGALGTLARAELAEAWVHAPGQWPWSTLLVNLLGAALLGAIVVRTQAQPHLHGLLGTGLCGGLTTFSTFQLEAVDLIDAGHVGLAVAYLAVSIGAGLLLATTTARLATPRAASA